MPAGFKTLGDNRIDTSSFELTGFSHVGCRRQSEQTSCLDRLERIITWQTKVKTHHRRTKIKHGLQVGFIERRCWRNHIRYFAESQFTIVGSEQRTSIVSSLRIIDRLVVNKKVGVIGRSGSLGYRRTIFTQSLLCMHSKPK